MLTPQKRFSKSPFVKGDLGGFLSNISGPLDLDPTIKNP
jgi:hypothetical protein